MRLTRLKVLAGISSFVLPVLAVWSEEGLPVRLKGTGEALRGLGMFAYFPAWKICRQDKAPLSLILQASDDNPGI